MFILKGSTVNHVTFNKYLQFYINWYTLFHMCYTIIYQSTLLYLYYVYVYSHALLSRIVFSLHVDRKEYYVILVFDNCHVDTTLIVIDPNMYNYITYVLSKWRLLMVIQHGNCNCSCLFSMFSILFFSIIIIEKLYIIQHLFLVYYSLFCPCYI